MQKNIENIFLIKNCVKWHGWQIIIQYFYPLVHFRSKKRFNTKSKNCFVVDGQPDVVVNL